MSKTAGLLRTLAVVLATLAVTPAWAVELPSVGPIVTAAAPGVERTVRVTVREMPSGVATAAAAPGLRPWGLTLEPLRGEREGVLVRRVAPASPALAAGLRPGDAIVEIDGKPVRSREDAERLLARPDRVLLLVRRGDETFFVPMKR